MWEGGKTIGSKECRCLLDDSCVNTNDEKGCKTWYKYPCKCSSTTNCDVGYVCNGQTGACTKCTDVSCDGGCQRAGNCEKGSAGEEGTGDNSNSNSGGSVSFFFFFFGAVLMQNLLCRTQNTVF
jgi:hypothetical protein